MARPRPQAHARARQAKHQRIHAAIQREAWNARAALADVTPDTYPHLAELVEAAQWAWTQNADAASFVFLGKRYDLLRTESDRLQVLDPLTKESLVSISLGHWL